MPPLSGIYQKKSDDILLARGNFRIEKFGLVFALASLSSPLGYIKDLLHHQLTSFA